MSRIKHLIVRAEAGPGIGAGHVMRMIALSQAWQDRGGTVTFAAIEIPDTLRARVEEEGFSFHKLTAVEVGSYEDAKQTAHIANEKRATWIVLDGYHFGTDFQKRIKECGLKLMAVDDHGYCDEWAVDLVFNQNISADEIDYGSTKALKGPLFALLRREFREEMGHLPTTKTGSIQRLLVSFGGADPVGATNEVLQHLALYEATRLQIRVIVGPANPRHSELKSLAAASPHSVELLSNVKDMREHYRWADGFIGAGGSTCWELLFYALRSALIPIAENQEKIVASLQTRRLAAIAGYFEAGCPQIDHTMIHRFLKTPDEWVKADNAKALVDGRGAERTAALLDNGLRICIGTSASGWMSPLIEKFIEELKMEGHSVSLATSSKDITKGDLLLLLSFWEVIKPDILRRNTHNLVVHASKLPEGRGWSPWIWQVIEGRQELTLSLIEAVDKVDAGVIYDQLTIPLTGSELLPDLRKLIFSGTIELCQRLVQNYPESVSDPQEQQGERSYYRRRNPADSELDVDLSLREQFNLLRVVDNDAYPAFFELEGQDYVLKIERKESGT